MLSTGSVQASQLPINDQLTSSERQQNNQLSPTKGKDMAPPNVTQSIPPRHSQDIRDSNFIDHRSDSYDQYNYIDRHGSDRRYEEERSMSYSRRSPYMSRHSSSRGRDRSISPRHHHSSRDSYSDRDSSRRRSSRRHSYSPSPVRHRSHSRGSYYRNSYRPSFDRGRYDRDYSRPRKNRFVERGTEEDRKTTCNIFIGNLPYSYTENDIADMFEQYGRLKRITVPLDNRTRNNKGFAFVEYENRRDAEDAYDKYKGCILGGRAIRIDWDVGKEKKFNNSDRNESRSRSREPSYK